MLYYVKLKYGVIILNLGLDEIMLLLNGLDVSIELREYELLEIDERTEDDYRTRINFKQSRNLEWDLEDFKRYDRSRKREEIGRFRGCVS